jgi:hypothetical protein
MATYLVFSEFQHLIQLVNQMSEENYKGHLSNGRTLPISECYQNSTNNQWAIEVPSSWNESDTFHNLCHVLTTQVSSLDKAFERQRFTDIVASSLEASDAYRRLPHEADKTYILFASTREQNQKLVETLSSLVMTGIQAQPVMPAAKESHIYWKVTAAQLSQSVIHWTDGAWEEIMPDGASPLSEKVFVFAKHGYSTAVSKQLIYRLDWLKEIREAAGYDDGIWYVLLSPEEIQFVEISKNGFHDLLDVARLRVQEIYEPQRQHKVGRNTIRDKNKFEISIRLVQAFGSQHELERRIGTLRLEIQQRQSYLDALRLLEQNSSAYEAPEPLYLYDENEINSKQIERLLIELPDQAEGLQSIYYLKETLNTARLAGKFHILATKHALHPSDMTSPGTGLLLRRYNPQQGELMRFEMLPEWSRYGLRLYVQMGKQLRLIPDFELKHITDKATAEKIIEAFGRALMQGSKDYREWIFLLVPALNNHVEVLRLPISLFKPIQDAFDWQPSFDITLTPHRKRDAERKLTEVYDDTIAKALHKHVQTHVMQSYEQWHEDFTEQLRELKSRQDALEGQKTEIESQLSEAENLMADSAASRTRIIKELGILLENINVLLTQTQSHVEGVESIRKSLQSQQDLIRQRLAEIVTILNRIRARSQHKLSEIQDDLNSIVETFANSLASIRDFLSQANANLAPNGLDTDIPAKAPADFAAQISQIFGISRLNQKTETPDNPLMSLPHHAQYLNSLLGDDSETLGNLLEGISKHHHELAELLNVVEQMSQDLEAEREKLETDFERIDAGLLKIENVIASFRDIFQQMVQLQSRIYRLMTALQ